MADIEQAFRDIRRVLGEIPILASEQVGRFRIHQCHHFSFPRSDYWMKLVGGKKNLRPRESLLPGGLASFRTEPTPLKQPTQVRQPPDLRQSKLPPNLLSDVRILSTFHYAGN
jgi:hypothetical protein